MDTEKGQPSTRSAQPSSVEDSKVADAAGFWVFVVLATVAVAVLIGFYAWAYSEAIEAADNGGRWPAMLGAAGDSVAWITSLLTALALFAGAWTLRLQARELKEARDDRADQLSESRAHTQALLAQAHATRMLTRWTAQHEVANSEAQIERTRDECIRLCKAYIDRPGELAAVNRAIALARVSDLVEDSRSAIRGRAELAAQEDALVALAEYYDWARNLLDTESWRSAVAQYVRAEEAHTEALDRLHRYCS